MVRPIILVLALLALSSLPMTPAVATVMTLQEHSSAGITTVTVADTGLSSTSSSQHNAGGATTYTVSTDATAAALIKFDLNAIPDIANVVRVNSATLRLYCTTSGTTIVSAAQMAQDWAEGTSTGQGSGVCDGAQWFARNAGTSTPKASLVSSATGIWYVPNVTDLATDPLAPAQEFVRQSVGGVSGWGNWYNTYANTHYTKFTSLAALQGAGSIRGYFWDSAADRLYVNKNDYDVRYYSTSDRFTTSGGTITGSYINKTIPVSTGWVEMDVTSIAQNWIDPNGGVYLNSNNGLKIKANSSITFASSEYTANPALRPQLVLDVTLTPEPATLVLLAMGGLLAAIRRRRGC